MRFVVTFHRLSAKTETNLSLRTALHQPTLLVGKSLLTEQCAKVRAPVRTHFEGEMGSFTKIIIILMMIIIIIDILI